MVKCLLRLYARLPLPIIHFLGGLIGLVLYLVNPKLSRKIGQHITEAGVVSADQVRRIARKSAIETGKNLAETLAIWFRPQHQVVQWVKACEGWQHVETALALNKGIVFLTPHLGCYEITAIYYANQHPMTVLYRPHRKSWFAPIVEAGRVRDNITLAPTNLKGVRALLRSLKQGEAVGILPDQVPAMGEGEWSTFFGRPAYTMSLVGKLAQATQATVLMAYGERLSWGRGYIVHITPFEVEPSTLAINQAIEQLVRQQPTQYLWSYNRHKQPRVQKINTE